SVQHAGFSCSLSWIEPSRRNSLWRPCDVCVTLNADGIKGRPLSMKWIGELGLRTVLSVPLMAVLASGAALAEAGSGLPSETPSAFKARTDSFDYIKREEMVPMRDGVKLKTFVLIPKGADKAPILLTRTPYDAAERVLRFNSAHLSSVV